MKKTFLKAIILPTLLLTSCGGGSDSSSIISSVNPSSEAVSSAYSSDVLSSDVASSSFIPSSYNPSSGQTSSYDPSPIKPSTQEIKEAYDRFFIALNNTLNKKDEYIFNINDSRLDLSFKLNQNDNSILDLSVISPETNFSFVLGDIRNAEVFEDLHIGFGFEEDVTINNSLHPVSTFGLSLNEGNLNYVINIKGLVDYISSDLAINGNVNVRGLINSFADFVYGYIDTFIHNLIEQYQVVETLNMIKKFIIELDLKKGIIDFDVNEFIDSLDLSKIQEFIDSVDVEKLKEYQQMLIDFDLKTFLDTLDIYELLVKFGVDFSFVDQIKEVVNQLDVNQLEAIKQQILDFDLEKYLNEFDVKAFIDSLKIDFSFIDQIKEVVNKIDLDQLENFNLKEFLKSLNIKSLIKESGILDQIEDYLKGLDLSFIAEFKQFVTEYELISYIEELGLKVFYDLVNEDMFKNIDLNKMVDEFDLDAFIDSLDLSNIQEVIDNIDVALLKEIKQYILDFNIDTFLADINLYEILKGLGFDFISFNEYKSFINNIDIEMIREIKEYILNFDIKEFLESLDLYELVVSTGIDLSFIDTIKEAVKAIDLDVIDNFNLKDFLKSLNLKQYLTDYLIPYLEEQGVFSTLKTIQGVLQIINFDLLKTISIEDILNSYNVNYLRNVNLDALVDVVKALIPTNDIHVDKPVIDDDTFEMISSILPVTVDKDGEAFTLNFIMDNSMFSLIKMFVPTLLADKVDQQTYNTIVDVLNAIKTLGFTLSVTVSEDNYLTNITLDIDVLEVNKSFTLEEDNYDLSFSLTNILSVGLDKLLVD